MMDIDKGFKWFFYAWIVGAIFSVSCMIGVVWVVVHFVQKYW